MITDTQATAPNRVNLAPRPTTQMTIGCLIIPVLIIGGIGAFFILMRANATASLVVPAKSALLVYAGPDETMPLLARYGPGRSLKIIGRSEDWRWLKVVLWGNQAGWALRPLDILVWQLNAEVIDATLTSAVSASPPPISQVMIHIPQTTFTMGSPPGMGDADEHPAHVVTVSAFTIDKYEVTVGQYWQCLLAGACAAPTSDASQTEPYYYNDPSFDHHPAVNVPWGEANNYCAWQGKRLPTEAEWELVASWHLEKSAKLQWPWGRSLEQVSANVAEIGLGEPSSVGYFLMDRSPLGVVDLAGNVSEWVFDWYKVDYYSIADESDPIGPSHRRGEGVGRVVRGGSFMDSLAEARTTNRRYRAETYGYVNVGFRCAK